MYYRMLSRAQELEQVYIEMPKLKGKSEKVKLNIKANPHSLKENENLVLRSIVPSYENNHFSIFMVNIDSLQNKIIDLTNDVFAQVSDHICVVETWLSPNTAYSFNIPGRYISFNIFLQDNFTFESILCIFISGLLIMHPMVEAKVVEYFPCHQSTFLSINKKLQKKNIN